MLNNSFLEISNEISTTPVLRFMMKKQAEEETGTEIVKEGGNNIIGEIFYYVRFGTDIIYAFYYFFIGNIIGSIVAAIDFLVLIVSGFFKK